MVLVVAVDKVHKSQVQMDEQEILDVLVLGAGLSALTAAYEIQKTHSNVKLNLIEAKSKFGFCSLIPHILHHLFFFTRSKRRTYILSISRLIDRRPDI